MSRKSMGGRSLSVSPVANRCLMGKTGKRKAFGERNWADCLPEKEVSPGGYFLHLYTDGLCQQFVADPQILSLKIFETLNIVTYIVQPLSLNFVQHHNFTSSILINSLLQLRCQFSGPKYRTFLTL